MDLNTIKVAQFKTRFYRDFTYIEQPSPPPSPPMTLDGILDLDITNAFDDAQAQFNQGLFGNDAAITIAYLLLTAHMLCVNIKNADSGANGGGSFPVASRSVGGVSESYAIPDAYKNSPILAPYTTTSYGMQYLAMVLPSLVGNMTAVCGGANP